MSTDKATLDAISLCISGFGHTAEVQPVLSDWFEFLGGKPGEVVYVDGGSPAAAVRALTRALAAGLIDKLELLTPAHPDNDFHRCYIQEYQSGFLATRPNLLFIKLDCLPWRSPAAHDLRSWLAEDLAALARPEVFAITNTHLIDPPTAHEPVSPGSRRKYLVHNFASLNYALLTRARFDAAMHEQAGAFIASGFRGEYPPTIRCEPRYRRALLEWCWTQHCQAHRLRTLAREESPDYTIFHINKRGRKLLSYRRSYRARAGIEPALNQLYGIYRPPLAAWQRAGRALEHAVRSLRSAVKPG